MYAWSLWSKLRHDVYSAATFLHQFESGWSGARDASIPIVYLYMDNLFRISRYIRGLPALEP